MWRVFPIERAQIIFVNWYQLKWAGKLIKSLGKCIFNFNEQLVPFDDFNEPPFACKFQFNDSCAFHFARNVTNNVKISHASHITTYQMVNVSTFIYVDVYSIFYFAEYARGQCGKTRFDIGSTGWRSKGYWPNSDRFIRTAVNACQA